MLTLSPSLIEPVTGGLLCGMDVDGGPTPEQMLVLRAIVSHLWGRSDLDLRSVAPVNAEELAAVLPDKETRTMFHELHLTLEACRHPQSSAQVAAVQSFAEVLEIDGDDLEIFRDLIEDGVDAAKRDYNRFLANNMRQRSEVLVPPKTSGSEHSEIDFADHLSALSECGPGSLGRAYLSFYERFGISLPGPNLSTDDLFFVAHDMTHTIAGISVTPEGEIALSAFQFAMNNNATNRAALLASLIAHEAGFAVPAHLSRGQTGLLGDPAAAELLGRELRRGSECLSDFSLVNHFDLAPLQLSEVREKFGVLPPVDPTDGHHWW